MKRMIWAATAALLVGGAQASVRVYEGFGDAASDAAFFGYTPGTASSGLTSNWTVNTGPLRQVSKAPVFVGITGGYTPNINHTQQQFAERQGNAWTQTDASVTMDNSIDFSTDGTYYMSFFALSTGTGANFDQVAQIGLRNASKELMFGWGYQQGLTANYGNLASNPSANGNNTKITFGANNTLFFVAKLDKTNSGVTGDKLTVSLMAYNLTTSGTIDNSDPTWLRTVDLGAVNDTFTGLKFKIDTGTGTGFGNVGLDELRLGDTWADVTGIPEPATLGIVVAFGGGLLFIRRKLMM